MRRFVFIMLSLVLGAVGFSVQGQFAYTSYRWEAANLSLAYPRDWDAPLSVSGGPREALRLAQGFVDTPDTRPPAIPILNITVTTEAIADDAQFTLLANAMQAIGVEARGALPADWLGLTGIGATGTDATGELFGMGRLVRLPDNRTLLMVGRAGVVRQDAFAVTFNLVADSIALSADRAAQLPRYGVRWLVEQLPSGGADAFINLGALAISPDGSTLVAADAVVGLVQFDSQTGQIRDTIAFDTIIQPSGMTIRPDGTIYLGDPGCQCVRVVRDGREQQRIENFGVQAPRSVAWLDGTFYATDRSETDVSILAVSDARIGRISFADPIAEQPLLAVDRRGQLLALVGDRSVYVLEGDRFSYAYDLVPSGFRAIDIAVDAQNNLVVGTATDGLIRFDDTGAEVDRLGTPATQVPPAPGSIGQLVGVGASLQGAIYWADSNGQYSVVAANEIGVPEGRVGLANLTPFVPVQGRLDEATQRQIWTFDAVADESIALTALTNPLTPTLNLALRVIAPDGSEVIYQDNDETGTLVNPLDVRLPTLTVAQTGRYLVIVEREVGVGRYQLGMTRIQPLTLNAGVNALQGEITDVFPAQRWIFDGAAGQTLTITMEAQSGTLDPLLRLTNADGDLIAENDDAGTPELGTNALIEQVLLPFSDDYILTATRFQGGGRYTLTIEVE